MGKLIVGLIVGLVAGAGGATVLGSGVLGGALGTGIAAGLSTGICSVVEAADQSGLLTAEQIDQVLATAARNMQAMSGENVPRSADAASSLVECRQFMSDLRAAQ